MLRKFVVGAGLAAGAMLAMPASALPIDRGAAAQVGDSQVTQIRWVCGYYGRCRWVVPYYAPRRYYYGPRRYYKGRYYY